MKRWADGSPINSRSSQRSGFAEGNADSAFRFSGYFAGRASSEKIQRAYLSANGSILMSRIFLSPYVWNFGATLYSPCKAPGLPSFPGGNPRKRLRYRSILRFPIATPATRADRIAAMGHHRISAHKRERGQAWRTFMASNIPPDSDAPSLRRAQLPPCTGPDCVRIQRLCHRGAVRWRGLLGLLSEYSCQADS